MLVILHALGYALSFLGLVLWAGFRKGGGNRRLAQRLTFLGIALYLGTLAGMILPEGEKLFWWSVDFLILAVVSRVMMLLKPKTIVWMVGVLAFTILSFAWLVNRLPEAKAEWDLGEPAAEGEWLVDLRTPGEFDFLRKRLAGLAEVRRAFRPKDAGETDLDDFVIVNVWKNDAKSLLEVRRLMQQLDYVDGIELNNMVKLDPDEGGNVKSRAPSALKSVNDPLAPRQWAMEVLEMEDFYRILRKRKPVRAGRLFILDTGVEAAHEDLEDNYRSLERRFDNDPVGHGTHCAGIAAAVTNNRKGIASFAFKKGLVQVTSIKVLNSNGSGTKETIIDGIIKAADNGADVISLSLGGRTHRAAQRAYAKAVRYAAKKGAIVVVAAGNANSPASGTSPANVPGVIAVTAVDSNLNRALFSNYLDNIQMGLAAPGVEILSTVPNDGYKRFNGTSMATPFVAGLITVMKAFRPKLNTAQVFDILHDTGLPTAQPEQTGPCIHPARALNNVLTKK